MMGEVRSLDACRRSAEQALAEKRVDVRDLEYETLVAVVPHRDGYRLCFGSGAVIHIDRGHTFDTAGNPVIEP